MIVWHCMGTCVTCTQPWLSYLSCQYFLYQGWLSDIFDEEALTEILFHFLTWDSWDISRARPGKVTPFMNITTVRRAHLHPMQWSRKDKDLLATMGRGKTRGIPSQMPIRFIFFTCLHMSSSSSVPLQGFFVCLTIALVRCAQCCGRESYLIPVTEKKERKSLLPRGLDFFLLQRLNLSGLRQHLALVGFWTLVGIGDLDFTRAVQRFLRDLAYVTSP